MQIQDTTTAARWNSTERAAGRGDRLVCRGRSRHARGPVPFPGSRTTEASACAVAALQRNCAESLARREGSARSLRSLSESTSAWSTLARVSGAGIVPALARREGSARSLRLRGRPAKLDHNPLGRFAPTRRSPIARDSLPSVVLTVRFRVASRCGARPSFRRSGRWAWRRRVSRIRPRRPPRFLGPVSMSTRTG